MKNKQIRYKMYKSGKRWVIAGLALATLGEISYVTQVHAAVTHKRSQVTTSSATTDTVTKAISVGSNSSSYPTQSNPAVLRTAPSLNTDSQMRSGAVVKNDDRTVSAVPLQTSSSVNTVTTRISESSSSTSSGKTEVINGVTFGIDSFGDSYLPVDSATMASEIADNQSLVPYNDGSDDNYSYAPDYESAVASANRLKSAAAGSLTDSSYAALQSLFGSIYNDSTTSAFGAGSYGSSYSNLGSYVAANGSALPSDGDDGFDGPADIDLDSDASANASSASSSDSSASQHSQTNTSTAPSSSNSPISNSASDSSISQHSQTNSSTVASSSNSPISNSASDSSISQHSQTNSSTVASSSTSPSSNSSSDSFASQHSQTNSSTVASSSNSPISNSASDSSTSQHIHTNSSTAASSSTSPSSNSASDSSTSQHSQTNSSTAFSSSTSPASSTVDDASNGWLTSLFASVDSSAQASQVASYKAIMQSLGDHVGGFEVVSASSSSSTAVSSSSNTVSSSASSTVASNDDWVIGHKYAVPTKFQVQSRGQTMAIKAGSVVRVARIKKVYGQTWVAIAYQHHTIWLNPTAQQVLRSQSSIDHPLGLRPNSWLNRTIMLKAGQKTWQIGSHGQMLTRTLKRSTRFKVTQIVVRDGQVYLQTNQKRLIKYQVDEVS